MLGWLNLALSGGRPSMKQSKKVLPVSTRQKENNTEKGATKRRAARNNHSLKTVAAVETTASEQLAAEDFETLVLSHRENGRKLARSILRRWRVRMPGEEIDSVVDLSLCETAKRYSSNRGASFMTFFFYHLRGHLVRTVARAAQGNNVFLAFAKNAGVETGDISSLSAETLQSYVPDYLLFQHRDGENPENLLIRQERIKQCRTACNKLDSLEREVIDRSFGSEEALVDVAKSLGYSRCHISRVKRSALSRLKGALAPVVVDSPSPENTDERPLHARVVLIRSGKRDRKSPLRRTRRKGTIVSLTSAKLSGMHAA